MKKIFQLFAILGLVFATSSCNSDPEFYTLEDQPDEMHVTANTDAIVLTADQSRDVAIHLKWTAIQSADPVTYLVRFYATNNKNENVSEFIEIGNATEYSITHNDLNSIIARWALPGDEISVTAQVVGTIHNELHYIKPQVSTVEFTAVGWEKYPTNLFIHFTNLSGKTSVTKLEQRNLGTGVYEAKMALQQGKFYFTKTEDKEFPAYYMDADGKIVYVNSEEDYLELLENGLEEFSCVETGSRTLIVDINDDYLDVRFLNIQLPDGGRPYVVGDGTDIEWKEKVEAGYMVLCDNPRTPYIYSYTGQFYAKGEFPGKEDSEGTFKILLADSFGGACFYAPENNCNPLENHNLDAFRTGGTDSKWLVPATGKYTFSINVVDMTTSFEPITQ